MSFKNDYASYSQECFNSSNLLFPLKVPFMNSVNNSKNESFTNKNTNTNTNDFALAWTCTERKDKTWYCPLRGDTY